MRFVEIPEGWFWMGRDDGAPAERPRHRVWLGRFEIGVSPVTNLAYAEFLTATGATPPPFLSRAGFDAPGQPVVGVSWIDAAVYAAWLTATRRRGHRLPTEAEWEKAARGGLPDARYPWGDEAPERVFPGIHPPLDGPPTVGSGPANGFGLTDLSGVVHEWCLDWHDDRYYDVSPVRDPRGPATGTRRVSRGGAWRHQIPWSPVGHRSSLPPGLRYSDYGLRLVREL